MLLAGLWKSVAVFRYSYYILYERVCDVCVFAKIIYYVRSSRQTRWLPTWKLVSCFVAFICNFFLLYFMFIFVYVHHFIFNTVLLYTAYNNNNNNDIVYYYIYETKTWTNLCIYFYFSTDYILIKNYLFIYAWMYVAAVLIFDPIIYVICTLYSVYAYVICSKLNIHL
jgi:hypothetical protein